MSCFPSGNRHHTMGADYHLRMFFQQVSFTPELHTLLGGGVRVTRILTYQCSDRELASSTSLYCEL